jgi:hypothetical protein
MISRWRTLCCGPLLVMITSCGCGQSRYGESVRVAQDRQSRLVAGAQEALLLSLPDQAAFNVAESNRTAQGTATAESFADPGGTAACGITVPPGGSATAEFQLGHMLRNATDTVQSVAVQVNLSYRYDGGTNDAAAPSFAGLKLFIRDDRERILRRVRLMTREDLFGAVRREANEAPVFELQLEPRTAYGVVVAGKLQAEVGDDAAAVQARFEVSALIIEVRSQS